MLPGSRLPALLSPDIAYFDAGEGSSLDVDPATGQVSQQRDLLNAVGGPSQQQPVLTWLGSCLYDQSKPTAAGGSVYMDGAGCYAKLSAPLCNGACSRDAYTVVVVARFGQQAPGSTILSVADAGSSPPSKRLTWRYGEVLTRDIPAGGFNVQPDVDPGSPRYNATPAAAARTVLRTAAYNDAWAVSGLVLQPSAGKRGLVSKATWLQLPRPYGFVETRSGRSPGIFAPVGEDFVIGCDYMEIQPDAGSGNATGAAPLARSCLPNQRTLRARVAAVLVYGQALREGLLSRILDFHSPRWAPLPQPLPLPSPSLGPIRGLPADLLPDLAFFDAGDLASLTIDSTTGRVTAQRDLMSSPAAPRPFLTWSGDCRWDPDAGGSVKLDGKSCFALLNWDDLTCNWERGMDGFTMVMLAQLDSNTPHESAVMMSGQCVYEPDTWNGFTNRMLAWRLDNFRTRDLVAYVAPENDDPNNEYDEFPSPEAWATPAFFFDRMPYHTWSLEAVVGRANREVSFQGTARYYRGGLLRGGARARKLYSGYGDTMQAPSGVDFAVGCDYMEFQIANVSKATERRCDKASYFPGRIAAVLAYARELPAADVSRLLDVYRTTWRLAGGGASSPPAPPSPPPSPPMPSSPAPSAGLLLPAALMPDLAYFDAAAATAGRLVVPRDGGGPAGRVGALLDALHPEKQRLNWIGDCRYDSSAGGGAILLDGASCYAELSSCLLYAGWKDLQVEAYKTTNKTFSMIVVLALDNSSSSSPRPPAPPSWEDEELGVGDLDMGGMGILSYGMRQNFNYPPKRSLQWTTTSIYKTLDGFQDYHNIDSRWNIPTPVPYGVWSMEVITSYNYDIDGTPGYEDIEPQQDYSYSRGTADEAPGTVTKVSSEPTYFPLPDGTAFRVGCTWRASDLHNDCQPGSHLRGRLSAVLLYSRLLEQEELMRLHAHFSSRWAAAGGGGGVQQGRRRRYY
ncbi:hypothetical protein HYH02_007894 [Chlamydomonas schloesseri]|uniref:Uncharacterized protein n=1 Tax=Chlamydomonas schloesseri TaxID=2026947 RepID=A0A835WGM2_9CHLO|nr:hypothetical protein HYH02_007894 [Chlamydomonas schloesseri]|eukprot:KAG2447148.1 hypothetical protein HYH02_007894 [Chlamydomonas schloesseri]